MTKPGDLPERCSSFERPRKVFRPPWEFLEKIPLPPVHFARQKVTGFFDF
jgi:hypothetical protein